MILTVTMNPAVDKTCRTQELFPGRVNRMRSVNNMAGGKGINVSRILMQYSCDVTATGFLGGCQGEWLERQLEGMNIDCRFVKVEEETRSSMNIVADNGYVTEILEPGPMVSGDKLDEFLVRYESLLTDCSLVVLSGSVAPGIPEDIYGELIDKAAAKGKKTILDTSGDLLRHGVKAGPYAVKPNVKELEYLIGHKLSDVDEIRAGIRILLDQGIERVVVSMGDKGLLMADQEQCLFARTAQIKTVNTVGCGDSVVASLALSFLEGETPQRALLRAAAISNASASVFESGYVPLELAEKLMAEIIIEKI